MTGREERAVAPSLSIAFGATSDPIAVQISRQHNGYINLETICHCQQDADAVTRLKVRGYISDKVAETARKRIMVAIQMAVQP
jgi:hypothetical protein